MGCGLWLIIPISLISPIRSISLICPIDPIGPIISYTKKRTII